MKFDNVIGNPPYQKNTNAGRSHATPLYNLFTEKYAPNTCSNRCCFVMPSRWFAGGLSLDTFREEMLSRNDIDTIIHHDTATEFFPYTEIKGGVSIVYMNDDVTVNTNQSTNILVNGGTFKDIDLTKYDILVTQLDAYSIIDKVLEKSDNFITDIYISKGRFEITTNDERLLSSKRSDDSSYVKCYVNQTMGLENWIKTTDIQHNNHQWKVITPEAAHRAHTGFGNVYVIRPEAVYSQTYIGFRCPNKEYASNLKHYLETQFVNYMLSLRKITHHTSEKVLRWIPLLDMDKRWNDEMLYDHFELTDEEIKIIETTKL